MLTRKQMSLVNKFRETVKRTGHSFIQINEETGFCYDTLNKLMYNLPKFIKQATVNKMEHYCNKYSSKPVATVIDKEGKESVQPIPSKEEKYDLRVKEMLRDSFIEEYNKLLNPLGYKVSILIEKL